MFDWIGDFFKSLLDFFPKIIYLLYASLASLLDVFQLALRKLAGLDVYYDANGVPVAGDIVTNFIAGILGIDFDGNKAMFDYSALSTVFWSFVVFGVIITFVSVFVALIKSHYNYDEKAAKGPMQYVYAGLKAIVNIAIVPVIVVLGLYVSQAVLTAVDSITAGSTAAQLEDFNKADLQPVSTSRGLADNAQNKEETTYIYYDIFGVGGKITYGKNNVVRTWPGWDSRETALTGASTQTFSGVLFRAAAYNANRARTGHIKVGNTSIYGLEQYGVFSNPKVSPSRPLQEQALADMIDTAFVCHLHLSDAYLNTPSHQEVKYTEDGAGEWTSVSYFTTWLTKSIPAFSKFNIGAVWYYYDLWNFNFIIGFGAVIVCVSLFINIILGLMTRIFMCLGLFLVAPPLFGLGPVDGGKATKSWTENFMKQVLMAYGAILGMNIFFLIFPLINQIKFFNIAIADAFMTTLIIIVGLISIKAFISVVSGLVGGEDANKTGEGIKEEVGTTMGKAVKATVGAATMPFKVGTGLVRGGLAAKNAVQAMHNARKEHGFDRKAKKAEKENKETNKLINKNFDLIKTGKMSEQDFLEAHGDTAENRALFNAIQNSDSVEEAREAYAQTDATYAGNVARAQNFRNLAERRAQLKSEAADRMLKHGRKAKGLLSPLSLVKDAYMNDKGLKAAKDALFFEEPPEKRTARAAEQIARGINGHGRDRGLRGQISDMNAGMNQGFGTLNQGMGTLNQGMGSLNQNVTTGFNNTTGAINSMDQRRIADINNEIAGAHNAGVAEAEAAEHAKHVAAGKKASENSKRRKEEYSRQQAAAREEAARKKSESAKKGWKTRRNRQIAADLQKQMVENPTSAEGIGPYTPFGDE